MCNDYRLEVDIASIAEDFDNLQIKIDMPEGAPNVPAREDVRITDTAPIVKSSDGASAGSIVNRRWSWPGQGGKPVYNVRSERRDLGMQRCLVLCDGFYEFTDPTDPAQKRLDKWLFTVKDHRWFCMAGVWRDSHVGEAFSLLTMDAGPDIAPFSTVSPNSSHQTTRPRSCGSAGISAMIARANGVGPKLAQRITHELKDKAGALGGISGSGATYVPTTPGPLADAVTALTGLGFKPGEASAAVAAASEELGADASLDALVRVALKKAAK